MTGRWLTNVQVESIAVDFEDEDFLQHNGSETEIPLNDEYKPNGSHTYPKPMHAK